MLLLLQKKKIDDGSTHVEDHSFAHKTEQHALLGNFFNKIHLPHFNFLNIYIKNIEMATKVEFFHGCGMRSKE